MLGLAALGISAAAAVGDSTQAVVATIKSEVKVKKKLTDLQPTVAGPFDKAQAELTINSISGAAAAGPYASTILTLKVKEIDKAVTGMTYGVHLHVGPCVAGDGVAAGTHYNNDMVSGMPMPMRINPRTEIWLDATVTDKGEAESSTTVKWLIVPGTRSLVFHTEPTADSGAAGVRQACLPVVI